MHVATIRPIGKGGKVDAGNRVATHRLCSIEPDLAHTSPVPGCGCSFCDRKSTLTNGGPIMKTRERLQVDLELIDDNPWQPRQEIDQETLPDLADTIHQLGLLQAPLGRRDTIRGRIQLAFGHRRVAACRLLQQQGRGESYIDMDVADITNEEMAILALTENEGRKQLTDIEVVRAHKRAIAETELTVQSLADQLGIPRPTLANNLRVLDLPDFVLEHVEAGDLKPTVAREFLVLQNATHAHVEDMRQVIRRIVSVEMYGGGVPNWTRRHVRKLISEGVSYNELDWRPLGAKTGPATGGGNKEASFNVDEFSHEFADALHTVPADDGHVENYRLTERYDQSRVWTCEVKEWSRRQSRATREANKATEASGEGKGHSSSPDAKKPDKLLGSLLAKDPVWRDVIAHRKKKGPNRPVTDEEREALGTRAELHIIGYSAPFYKILNKLEIEAAHELRQVEGLRGGAVPPWFPDLKECQECIIGAAYAASNDGYPLGKPVLACFNQEHYLEKLQAGLAAYQDQLAAQQKGIERQDDRAIQDLKEALLSAPALTKYPLAQALLSATPAMPGWHPLGFHHEDFCFETAPGFMVESLLGITGGYDQAQAIEFLDAMDPHDLPGLIAALMVHHLRQSGKLDAVSRETALQEAR